METNCPQSYASSSTLSPTFSAENSLAVRQYLAPSRRPVTVNSEHLDGQFYPRARPDGRLIPESTTASAAAPSRKPRHQYMRKRRARDCLDLFTDLFPATTENQIAPFQLLVKTRLINLTNTRTLHIIDVYCHASSGN